MLTLNRFVYFAGLYAASAALLKALGFVLSLWLARELAVEDYGRWGLFYAYQTGLTTFGLVGIFEAVVGMLKQHPSPPDRAGLYKAANSMFLRTMGVSLLIAAIGAAMYMVPAGASVVTAGCVLISGSMLAFASLQAQFARLEESHLSSLGFNFAVPLAGLMGSGICFALYRSVQSFFMGSAAGLALAMALWRRRAVGERSSDRSAAVRLQLLQRLAPFAAVAFFGWMSGYGNNFIVSALFTPADVARFTFALSIGSIMQLVASASNQVWSPHFFRITHSQPLEVVEHKNWQFFSTQSVVLGVLAALCIALLPLLLRGLGGNLGAYGSMSLELFFVLAGYIFLSPWWHCQNYLLAYDRGVDVMRVVVATSVIGIAAWIALMWWLGPLGIYAGFFTQMVARSVGIALFARGNWPVRIGWSGVGLGILVAWGGVLAARR